MNLDLLEQLVEIPGASGDEGNIKSFILDYVQKNQSNWKVKPMIYDGEEFQDAMIFVFGEPKTAIYAHIDTIGFTVAYDNELIKIGGPRIQEGIELVGKDKFGDIDTEIFIIEDENDNRQIKCISDRTIERGTNLTFKPNFKVNQEAVQSPYMDNRLGVFCALKVAETLVNGVIVFSTYEEHGGNSVGFCANFLYQKYKLKQALICDITWVTHGVVHGGGVAISMRDSSVPRKSYLNKIIGLAQTSGIAFQLEVESSGGSDGSMLQKSDNMIDWCFIGAPENHVHSPMETVYLSDIQSMIDMYKYLMLHL